VKSENKKILIVIGSAPCLEKDLAGIMSLLSEIDPATMRLDDQSDLMAIGLDCADRYLGRIEHVVTLHPEDFPQFHERREKAGGNLDYDTHTLIMSQPVVKHQMWPYMPPSGSSSLFGVEIAIKLNYKKIIIAGVLLERGSKYEKYQRGWLARYELIKNQVKAMSGYPQELLGAPTMEWINGKY